MLSKLQTPYLLCNIRWTYCLIRSSTFYTPDKRSQVKFDSISTAYGYKSKSELFRGWLVFKLCSYTSLVDHLNEVHH